MTIYFLRHEERPMEDSTFLTELTKNGKDRAASSLKEALIKQQEKTEYGCVFGMKISDGLPNGTKKKPKFNFKPMDD